MYDRKLSETLPLFFCGQYLTMTINGKWHRCEELTQFLPLCKKRGAGVSRLTDIETSLIIRNNLEYDLIL
jgi:hypothetical protein